MARLTPQETEIGRIGHVLAGRYDPESREGGTGNPMPQWVGLRTRDEVEAACPKTAEIQRRKSRRLRIGQPPRSEASGVTCHLRCSGPACISDWPT
jgi:hypothetical protein